MNNFILTRQAARLAVLQRIELAGNFLIRIRKLFGRYIFSNLITRFFLNTNEIGKKYYEVMSNEFLVLENFIKESDKLVLSIGGGIGGLELIINQKYEKKKFFFIERNYVSKKIKYGWGGKINSEAYNNLDIQKKFLIMNQMKNDQINIFDYDNGQLPEIKFDVVISLLSLDYHYDFDLYKDYLKKVSSDNTKIIFDTIRADYFEKIFKKVEIIKTDVDTVHKSKRIVCSEFLI
ncbi:hypothetical protein N9U81_04715 [Candidatus Pelagibacter sp.]|nr:hypothetical protein [Candidatus Pelagibacter sp.]